MPFQDDPDVVVVSGSHSNRPQRRPLSDLVPETREVRQDPINRRMKKILCQEDMVIYRKCSLYISASCRDSAFSSLPQAMTNLILQTEIDRLDKRTLVSLFYRAILKPAQSACNSLRRIG